MDSSGSTNGTSGPAVVMRMMMVTGALPDSSSSVEHFFLQGAWQCVRSGQERALRSPYLPAACALLTHVLLSAPFLLLDLLGGACPRVRAWRLRSGCGPPPSLRRWLRCLRRVALRYVTVVLPVTAAITGLRQHALPEHAPSCWRLCVEVTACFLLFDALFFIWHYCMHRCSWLYRWVHRAHHRHRAPFALAAQDASPLELLSLLLLALGSAALVDAHPLSEALFHLLNAWLAVEDHCGYDLPFALHHLLPGMGGTPFHHTHHRQQDANYAPYFTHWDRLFGTYRAPKHRRKHRQE